MSKIAPRSSAQIAATVPTVDCEPVQRGNYRNKALLAAVRLLPCVKCGMIGVHAAHSNRLIHGKGRGIKASDAAIMALCPADHYEIDNGKNYTKRDLETYQDAYIVKTYAALEREGKINIPAHVWKLHGNAEIALELIRLQEDGALWVHF